MEQGPDLLVKLEKLNVHKCVKCPRVFPTISDLMTHVSYHERFLSHVSKGIALKQTPTTPPMHPPFNLLPADMTDNLPVTPASSVIKVASAYVSVKRAQIFKCEKCTQSFNNKTDFMLHKLAHVQENVRNQRRINKLSINQHVVKPYKCPDCDVSFAAQSTLDAHSILHLPFPHICKCGIGYYEKQDLKCHIKLVHGPGSEADETELVVPQRKPKVILQSKSESTNRKTVIVKSVKKEKPKEKNCKVKMRSGEENTNGIKRKTEADIPKPDIDFRKNRNNKFECPKCKKVFKVVTNVIVHYRIHTGERPFECHLCPKAFNQTITLKKHIDRHFSKERIYVCTHCPKAFTQPDYRERHEKIHSAVKPHKCPYCGQRFHDPSALTRHKRIHTGEKPYRCPYCPKAFSDASPLIVHKLRHENKKQFKCEICDRGFYNRHSVNLHTKAIHAQKQFFTCDYCKRSLPLKYDLIMHILQKHRNIDKPFQCECCHAKYLDKKTLSIHIREKHKKCKFQPWHKLVVVHDDACSKKSLQKRIQCNKCFQYFASPTHLEEHKLVESEQCEICDEKFFCENPREAFKSSFSPK